jgi:sugar phosphate isomerase/epimerase
MLALSTSFLPMIKHRGRHLDRQLKEFGLKAVELEYRLPAAMVPEIEDRLKAAGICVVSVHNYFPFRPLWPGIQPSGDLFLLSHPQKEQRQQAVSWTTKTIEAANALEARVVVLHCGCVDMAPEIDALEKFYKEGRIRCEKARGLIRQKCAERQAKKARHLDSLMFSLDSLLPVAERQGVLLGLENRYHYHELPGPDEFGLIFDAFKGAPLGYWHDTGHAHANEALGLLEPGVLLKRYHSQLIGMHLHDARGLTDHLPPGSGEIDFKSLNDYLGPETLRVIELKPGTSARQVQEGIAHLRHHMTGPGLESAPKSLYNG